VAGVAFGHHVGGLEDRVGDLGDGELLVVGFLGGNDGGVGGEHEMDAGVGDQVGLELGHVNVQGAVETQGGGQGGDDLTREGGREGGRREYGCGGRGPGWSGTRSRPHSGRRRNGGRPSGRRLSRRKEGGRGEGKVRI